MTGQSWSGAVCGRSHICRRCCRFLLWDPGHDGAQQHRPREDHKPERQWVSVCHGCCSLLHVSGCPGITPLIPDRPLLLQHWWHFFLFRVWMWRCGHRDETAVQICKKRNITPGCPSFFLIKEWSELQKPLSEALLDHQLLTTNGYEKITRHKSLHLAFQALHGFVASRRRLPLPRSDVSANAEKHSSRDGYKQSTTKFTRSSMISSFHRQTLRRWLPWWGS